jgi:hypothetical protein
MHFFIHNSFHAGDVLLTKLLIIALREKYPDLQITLECRERYRYLWEDLTIPVMAYEGSNHFTTIPTPNCPHEAVFLNMWFGVYYDILSTYDLTYANSVHTFNRQMQQNDLDGIYRLSLPQSPPVLTFYAKPKLPFQIKKNSVFIENGKTFSGQNVCPINEYLEDISILFSELTFYCSAPPPLTTSNLIDCSNCNLIQLSEISNYCKALITIGSGANAATYTENNRFKPRCLVGMNFPVKIWDNTIQNPVFTAKSLFDVLTFLHLVSNENEHERFIYQNFKFDYSKMCKFLKSRIEIAECSYYLYKNGYISHSLPCKNWEMAHILANIGDGNLLDMGSTDSYILKNAILKKISGRKFGIDFRMPDFPVDGVEYLIDDLLHVPLPDSYFKNITCLSVIEHEVDFTLFAAEASRLLEDGGKLYVTFDYWVPKINTSLKLYGRKWQPLTDWDVIILQNECEEYKLKLIEEINWHLGEAVIRPGYYSPHPQISYTFGMLVFEKFI